MIAIAIVTGSTRPNRNNEAVSKWVLEHVKERKGVTFELVDIADFNLPLLDEAAPPMMQKYTKDHTKKWSEKISQFDGYIFVTPEYNHGTSGALKNAIDYLYAEWNNKVAGFVSYGSMGGTRAVEQLRQVMAELQIADVRAQVTFSLSTDFVNMSQFKPSPGKEKQLDEMLDQLIAWAGALQPLRATRSSQ